MVSTLWAKVATTLEVSLEGGVRAAGERLFFIRDGVVNEA